MNEAAEIYKGISDSVVFLTQLAIVIITAFVGVAAVITMFVAHTNYKAAKVPREELQRLRAEMEAVRKELEELKEFKKELSQHTFLSVD